jgi:ribosomal protein S18 acetylase RimI-like enzyme
LLDEAQIETAAQALTEALLDDPLFAYVQPEPAARAHSLAALLAAQVRFGLLYGEVYTTAGSVDGVALWQPPGVEITPERAAECGLDRLSEIFASEALLRLGRTLDYLNAAQLHNLQSDHWYLMALGVLPARQRQGLGGALLQPVLHRASASQTPCILNTTQPANLAFYQKHGFRSISHAVEPDSGLNYWTLQREPT